MTAILAASKDNVIPMSNSNHDLDWKQFEAITCNLSPEFMEIYREFEAEFPKLLRSLQDAVATSSFQQVATLAHQIKGTAANFGFIGISKQMDVLEQDAQNMAPEHAKQHLSTALEAFKRAQIMVNSKIEAK